MNEILNPPSFVKPVGYAHMVRSGPMLFLGGVTGMDEDGVITHPADIVGQMDRALANIQAALTFAGGAVTDIVRMRIYTTDMALYRANLKPLGHVWQKRFGKHYPAMALFGIQALFDPAALVEIESEAVLQKGV